MQCLSPLRPLLRQCRRCSITQADPLTAAVAAVRGCVAATETFSTMGASPSPRPPAPPSEEAVDAWHALHEFGSPAEGTAAHKTWLRECGFWQAWGLWVIKGRVGAAETLLRSTIAMLDDDTPEDHLRAARCRHLLAMMYLSQEREKEAIPHLTILASVGSKFATISSSSSVIALEAHFSFILAHTYGLLGMHAEVLHCTETVFTNISQHGVTPDPLSKEDYDTLHSIIGQDAEYVVNTATEHSETTRLAVLQMVRDASFSLKLFAEALDAAQRHHLYTSTHSSSNAEKDASLLALLLIEYAEGGRSVDDIVKQCASFCDQQRAEVRWFEQILAKGEAERGEACEQHVAAVHSLQKLPQLYDELFLGLSLSAEEMAGVTSKLTIDEDDLPPEDADDEYFDEVDDSDDVDLAEEVLPQEVVQNAVADKVSVAETPRDRVKATTEGGERIVEVPLSTLTELQRQVAELQTQISRLIKASSA